jgi:hypothetical protein
MSWRKSHLQIGVLLFFLKLLELAQFSVAVNTTSHSLSVQLLWSKPVPVELTVSGIYEANILIYLQFQVLSRLAQHFIYCISCSRKTQLNTLFLSIYGSRALVHLGCLFFSFLILYTVCRIPWTGDQPVAKQLPTHRTTQTQNKHKQTSILRVGFEPMIPVFERVKTVHALDRSATVIGTRLCHQIENRWCSLNSHTNIRMMIRFLTDLYNIIFTNSPHRKTHCSSVHFAILMWYFKWEPETDFWMKLRDQKHKQNWYELLNYVQLQCQPYRTNSGRVIV